MMASFTIETMEEKIITIVKEICKTLKIEVTINGDFCPGDYIKSQILLDATPDIEEVLGVVIPNECYVFSEKNRKQLSIRETVQKILKVIKNGNKK